MALEWPVVWPDCAGYDPDADPDGVQGIRQAAAEAAATAILWHRTAGIYGVAAVTVRPCIDPARPVSVYYGGAVSVVTGGAIVSGGWRDGGCGGGCSAGTAEIELPGPVVDITSVVIDGVALAATHYRIRDGRYLLRVDGDRWPLGQDMTIPDGQPGTWSVTYRRGAHVPLEGRRAAGLLACEYLKAASGGACALPDNVVSISRQGVSYQLADLVAAAEGSTGIPAVDAWIGAVNPGKARSAPRVINPGTRTRTHRIR